KGEKGTKLVYARSDNGGGAFTPPPTPPPGGAPGGGGGGGGGSDRSGRAGESRMGRRDDRSQRSSERGLARSPRAGAPGVDGDHASRAFGRQTGRRRDGAEVEAVCRSSRRIDR